MAYLGSPPQVRGKQSHVQSFPDERRDHPRRCGENVAHRFIFVKRVGSPPQVRGKLVHGEGKVIMTGITPAGAGKTQSDSSVFPNI